MELYQLKTFTRVADEGNLTRAAGALYTSQPAISAQIKALEDELGLLLFSRTPKGMVLTAAGKRLYEQAKTTLAAAELLQQQAQQLRNELAGELRIGLNTDYEFLRIGELFRELSKAHPHLVPHFLLSSTATVQQELRRDNIDAGFMFGPCNSSDIDAVHLQDVPMRILGPAAWRDRIVDAPLESLAELPWVYSTRTCLFYQLFEGLFAQFEQPPRDIVWCDMEEAIRALVRSEVGLSVVKLADAQQAEKEGYGCSWNGDVPSVPLSFVTLKQRAREPIIEALRNAVTLLWQPEARQLKRIG